MRRCERCGFLSDEKIPVGDDGLCLWCRLTEQEVDWAAFYESGAWMEVIEWRGEPSPGDQVREMLRQRKDRAEHTWADVEELIGSAGCQAIKHFLGSTQSAWLSDTTVEAIAQYLKLPLSETRKLLGDLVLDEEPIEADVGAHIYLDWPEARRLTRRLQRRKAESGDSFTDLKREYGISHGVWYRFVDERYDEQQDYVWARTLRRFADYLDLPFAKAVALVQA